MYTAKKKLTKVPQIKLFLNSGFELIDFFWRLSRELSKWGLLKIRYAYSKFVFEKFEFATAKKTKFTTTSVFVAG